MANKLKIQATTYAREDGLALIRLPSGGWVIRKVFGPSWFWSKETSNWGLVNDEHRLESYELPFEEAYALFESLPEQIDLNRSIHGF